MTSGVQGNTGYVTRSTAVSGNPYPATDALATFVVDGVSTTAVTNGSTVLTTLNRPPVRRSTWWWASAAGPARARTSTMR